MQTYPPSLPEWQTPYTDQQSEQFIQFSTDTGPGKQRKQYTGRTRELSVMLTLNGSQRNTLDDLYNGGDFEYKDPKYDDSIMQGFRFIKAPSYNLMVGGTTPSDRYYKAKLELYKLP